MKNMLKPLSGKYYGTVVMLDGNTPLTVWVKPNVSVPSSKIPSPREFERSGFPEISVSDWHDNVLVIDANGYEDGIKEAMGICDDHFETLATYELALNIVENSSL